MKKRNYLMQTVSALLFCAAVFLLISSIGYKRDSPSLEQVIYVDSVLLTVDGSAPQQVNLPLQLKGLEPFTTVTAQATVYPHTDDGIFVQADYTQAVVYFDGQEVFRLGRLENYPPFLREPGREIHIVEAHGDGGPMELAIEYVVPQNSDGLLLFPPMVGTSKELIMERMHRFGLGCILSTVQIVTGMALILVAACITLFDRKGRLFFWLGLFSALSGCWFFGSNQFCITVIPHSASLYLSSLMGLALAPIALIHFLRSCIEYENPRPALWIEGFYSIFALLALVLQIAGTAPLLASIRVYAAMLPFPLLAVLIITIREYLVCKNTDAGRFIFPMVLMSCAAFCALLNYLYPFSVQIYYIVQACTLLFLFLILITAGIYVKDSIHLQKQREQLHYDQELLEIRSEEQAKSALRLVRNEQSLSRQRHDLRHQLAAIQALADPDNLQLQSYLENLLGQIPPREHSFCENPAVDAVVSHYDSMCRSQGVRMDIQLAVPAENPHISDGALCAIFGNLMENAMEACSRMTDSGKFIRLRSNVRNGILTVTMDNSFSGPVRRQGDRFRSSKRTGFGVGLSSIQSMAQSHGGDASFLPDDSVFRSSVYLHL